MIFSGYFGRENIRKDINPAELGMQLLKTILKSEVVINWHFNEVILYLMHINLACTFKQKLRNRIAIFEARSKIKHFPINVGKIDLFEPNFWRSHNEGTITYIWRYNTFINNLFEFKSLRMSIYFL